MGFSSLGQGTILRKNTSHHYGCVYMPLRLRGNQRYGAFSVCRFSGIFYRNAIVMPNQYVFCTANSKTYTPNNRKYNNLYFIIILKCGFNLIK